ncbi:hypothetical protein Tco_1122906 [Tanacetum coccineum]|uniref:Uncharacterized protein n=1 Tax=Tanacetum coccineum TaxID=301880 RepID=A0ABQ5J1T9_9ASTR
MDGWFTFICECGEVWVELITRPVTFWDGKPSLDVVWEDLVGLPLPSGPPEVYKRWVDVGKAAMLTDIEFEDDAGEILGVHSQVSYRGVMLPLMTKRMLRHYCSEKTPSLEPPSTPPGNDINMLVESVPR